MGLNGAAASWAADLRVSKMARIFMGGGSGWDLTDCSFGYILSF